MAQAWTIGPAPHAVRALRPGRGQRRRQLLLGVAVGALLPAIGAAAAPAPFSGAWFAARGANANAAAVATARAASTNTAASYAQVQQSLADLQKAASAIAAMRQLQLAAHAAVAGSVANGLAAGGLVPDTGLAASGIANPTTSWTGAAAPVQTGSAAAPTVTVKQTASTALLNWSSFNVGAATTLSFDQSAGGTAAGAWVVLNRVSGATASTILGTIEAQGHVLILNGNGILFGPTATVNVGALVASTADISAAQFAANGIYSTGTTTPSFTGAAADVTVAAGAAITTTAPLTATSAGGGVILLGRNVSNAGAITTPAGQTILGAGVDFVLRPGYSVSGTGTVTLADGSQAPGLIGNVTSTTLGSEIAVTAQGGAATNAGLIEADEGDVTMVGHAVKQAGVIVSSTSLSQRGTIHLLTDLADTTASVTLAAGSVTTVVPDANSATATDAQLETDMTNSTLANQQRAAASLLNDGTDAADTQYASRIEITTGGVIDFAPNSLTMAQSGQIVATSPARIEAESGAILDVSGSVGVTLPMSANDVAVDVQGYELRDDVENRDTGKLANATVEVDMRDLVTLAGSTTADQGSSYTATAREYTAGGLLEVSGEVANVEHTIGEFTAAGGSILFTGNGSTTSSVVAQSGSVFDLAGGTITYAAGLLPQSWLIGPGGVLYNANTAPGTLTYSGIYEGIVQAHKRWNVTTTYTDPLIAPSEIYQSSTTIGRDAGTLTIAVPSAAFSGTIDAAVVNGPGQTKAATAGLAAVLQGQTAVAQSGGLLIGQYDLYGLEGGFASTVTLAAPSSRPAAADTIAPTDALPASLVDTVTLDTSLLDADGLGTLAIASATSIAVDSPVTLAAGGALTLAAPSVTVAANLTAHGGAVTLGDLATAAGPLTASTGPTFSLNTSTKTPSQVTLASGAAIDVSGSFTNALLDPADVAGEATEAGGTVAIDTTGGVTLAAGSLIDASAGAEVSSTSAVTSAAGGAVSVIGDDPNAYASGATVPLSVTVPDQAVALLGTIRAVGETGGGAFTLRAPSVLITGDPTPVAGRTLLAPSFFDAGFRSYTIDGYGTETAVEAADAAATTTEGTGASTTATTGIATASAATLPGVEVAAGTSVAPVMPVYALGASALLAATGREAESLFGTYLPSLYSADRSTAVLSPRAGASLSLVSKVPVADLGSQLANEDIGPGGSVLVDPGASIAVDPGQDVTIEAIGQITVAGRITAHGGAITLQNDTYEPGSQSPVLAFVDGMSIWVGSDAVLDVSGQAITATDDQGRAFGDQSALAGGTIRIGGAPGSDGGDDDAPMATSALVIIRPGALLDASGSSAEVDASAGLSPLAASQPLLLEGAGGTIDVNSESAIALDGTMVAQAGGANAAGGSLVVDLVHPIYGSLGTVPAYTIPDALTVPYEVFIGQATEGSGLAADLAPGDTAADAIIGQARVSAQQVSEGGFGNLTIGSGDYPAYGPDVVRFDGNVTLSATESIDIPALLADRDANAHVVLSAPLVTLNSNSNNAKIASGEGINAPFGYTNTRLGQTATASELPSTSTLTVDADTIVLGIGSVAGIHEAVPLSSDAAAEDAPVYDEPGFATTSLVSAGDVVLLPPADYPTVAAPNTPTFGSNGDLSIEAARLYVAGAPGAKYTIALGLDDAGATNPAATAGTLTLSRTPGTTAATPLTADTSLTLSAANIVQGGVIEQPFGAISFGSSGGTGYTDSISFLPGSVTSVSGDGATIPYGGTQDGVSYAIGSESLTYSSSVTPSDELAPAITLAAQSVAIEPGATLDLRGGGTLAGAGFNSGRGGSTDALVTPFTVFSGTSATQPADAIYAVVPGYTGATPLVTDTLTSYTGSADATPALGTTITLAQSAGGLPAGTYTLLPAYDALLPGGFRVEVTGTTTTLATTAAIGNLSTQTSATFGVAGTAIRGTQSTIVDITSGTAVRDLSSYDEEDYGTYITDVASTFGLNRVAIPADSGSLVLDYAIPVPAAVPILDPPRTTPALTVAGDVLFAPAAGGDGGAVTIETATAATETADHNAIDIVAGDAVPPLAGNAAAIDPDAAETVVLGAADLDRLDANSLYVGASLTRATTISGESVASYTGQTSAVTVASGVDLTAGEVVLAANGPIAVDAGAVIDTVGRGDAAYTPPSGTAVTNAQVANPTAPALLVVSNAALDFATPASASSGTITVADGATLVSGGSIGFVTAGAVNIGQNATLATADLSLALSTLNITAGTGLPAGAVAPSGVTLTQAFIDNLLTGAGGLGPALQRVVFTASSGIDFYGTVSLSLGAGGDAQTLELNTPSIYGYGSPSDVATISAGTIVWNGIASGGVATQPSGVVTNGPGSGAGTLVLAAQTIVLGYGPGDFVPATSSGLVLPRATYGFVTVDLDAASEIVANGHSALAVYQSQGAYAGSGYANTGGALNLVTPLLTADAGATLAITAGDAVSLTSPGGTVARAAGLGGEIDVAGASIAVANSVALPEGKLVLDAAGDITLGAGAALSLPGEATVFSDVTEYGPGGTLLMESTAGNITADPAALIDVSAAGGAAAGSVSATATAGTVSLAGAISGAGGGGALDGNIAIRAGTLTDFAGLNQRLTAGGVDGTRDFEIGTGDLTIDGADELQAHAISISLDAGSLTVDGPVNASGTAPGSISLSAGDNLTLTGNAVLDAHGTVAQTDSTGATIDSENAALVTLRVADASAGTLTIAPSATINVSAAPGVTCATGACGDVEIDAPRTGSATAGTVAVSATGSVNILGAGTVALNAFRTYVPADGVIDQATLDGYGADATAFIDAALGGSQTAAQPTLNATLATQLAGLAAYAPVFHLRPGIEIDSTAANGGDLTVSGDLDLSGLRTASLDPGHPLTGVVGSGEPGVLVLRAANDLDIDGSITDGFDQPVDTAAAQNPDDNGWILETDASFDVQNGTAYDTLDVNLVVPANAGTITLPSGTAFQSAAMLNYDITVASGTLDAGTVLPISITLAGPVTLASQLVASGDVTDATGSLVYARGTLIPAGTVLQANWSLGAGFVLQTPTTFAGTNALTNALQIWPANHSLSAFTSTNVTTVTTAADLTLTAGDVIPTGTALIGATGTNEVTTPDGSLVIALRPTTTLENGLTGQGEVYAVGAQMPAGSLSWSYDFVSGANLLAADPTAVQARSVLAATGMTGNTILSDLHDQTLTAALPDYGYDETAAIETFSLIRTGTGSITFATGGDFRESTLYGIYTAGTASNGTDGTAYDLPTGTNAIDPTNFTAYAAADSAIHADYATGGGNLTLAVQGSLDTISTSGLVLVNSETSANGQDSATGEWLFRQGDGTAADPGAWWINFGSYLSVGLETSGVAGSFPFLVGFSGIGTLGGGNLAISAGGTAGASQAQSSATGMPGSDNPILLPDETFANFYSYVNNFSLTAVVASTGRADAATGTTLLTGGGALTLALGGALDPALASGGAGSTVVAMRGDATITAASAGSAELGDDGGAAVTDPYTVTATYGPTLILGDSAASIATRGDIALADVGDPTRTITYDQSANGDVSWFSLWTATTAISLSSAGGNISPFDPVDGTENSDIVYPPILNVTAASGSIVYDPGLIKKQVGLVVAPSAQGVVNFLAATSIVGDDAIDVPQSDLTAPAIDISGADLTSLPAAADPAYVTIAATGVVSVTSSDLDSNALLGTAASTADIGNLFVLGSAATTGTIHTDGAASHFYTNTGDIEHLVLGQTVSYATATGVTPSTQYFAAMPTEVRAGGDIVDFGGTSVSNPNSTTTGGLLWNDEANDISVIAAGGDAYFVNTAIAGPGTLEINTGGNLYQGSDGVVESIGVKTGADANSTGAGASLLVTTGVNSTNTAWTAFASLYLDADNLANNELTLAQQPGRVERTYQDQLLSFLQARGYTGDASGALAAFQALPLSTREILLLQVYYAELNQSGLDYNDAASRFYRSYDEGDEAISTLFPATDLSGQSAPSGGSITLFGGSGFRTDYGGNIEFAVPDGGFTVGVTGATPPATAGVITQGSGDVDLYTYGGIPLGESRIFTTYGGNILIWMSSDGTVNAGQGSKTTVLYTPPDITYDDAGDITLSPTVPSTGAGIATLSPVPSVPAGDINVVTPVGTVDVGEAGIRSSGNVNVAALVVVNAANITAGGSVTGVPVVAVPNVTATAAASAAAAATTNSATSSLNKATAQQSPAIITVEVTGDDTSSETGTGDDRKRRSRN